MCGNELPCNRVSVVTMRGPVQVRFLTFAVAVVASGCGTDTPKPTDKSAPPPLTTQTPDDSHTFDVAVNAPDSAAANQPAEAVITVTPTPGWKLNDEFPTKLTVAAPQGVTVDTPVIDKKTAKRFTKARADFAVTFRAPVGTQAFSSKLRFAVCTVDETVCIPKTETIRWKVAVR